MTDKSQVTFTPFTLDQHQMWCMQYKKWPNSRSLEYLAMGIAGEAGEVVEIIKKATRKLPENHVGSVKEVLTDDQKTRIADEVMDVMYYCSAMLHDIGYTPSRAFYELNYPKLKGRHSTTSDIEPYDFRVKNEPEDFKDRLVKEKDDLAARLTKLFDFLKTETFQKLDSRQKSLLVRQSDIMNAHITILNGRIALL